MESLRGMISFVQTARAGSFTAAAQALGISAVAVSRNVARLEAQLGLRLFARSTRSLSLTAEGQALLARCEAPLEELDQAFKHSREQAGSTKGVVRVTSVSPFARHYLVPVLPQFQAQHPGVCVDLQLSDHVADLVAERFDVGIRVGPLRDAAFVARPLGPLALVLCAAPSYLARAGHPTALDDLARHAGLALKLHDAPAPTPWWLQTPAGLKDVMPSGALICNDFVVLTEACCAGLGLAQLPLVAALPALRAGRLQVLLPQASPAGLQLYVHYPNRHLPARVRVFVDFVWRTLAHHPDLHITPDAFAGQAALPQAVQPRATRKQPPAPPPRSAANVPTAVPATPAAARPSRPRR